MWFELDGLGDRGEALLASVGRALLVAQLFEDLVKRTLYWDETAAQLPGLDPIEAPTFLAEKAHAPEDSFESKLARAIDILKARFNLSDDHARLLTMAKVAPNYVAHESALESIPVSRAADAQALAEYRSQLEILIRGYNLLSPWAYEFQEREPAPVGYSRRYPRDLSAWVLEPIVRAEGGPRR